MIMIAISDDDSDDTYVSNIFEGISNGGNNNTATTTSMMKVLV